MTIKRVDYGTPTTVISHAATLTNGSYTYSGLTGLTMTEFDNSSNLYPWAFAVLSVPDTFSAAPSAGAFVNLLAVSNDVDGTNDETPAPDSTALKIARLVGRFPITAYDVAQRVQIVIDILRFKKANFHIENKTGVSMNYTSNPITVIITPVSLQDV